MSEPAPMQAPQVDGRRPRQTTLAGEKASPCASI